MNFSFLGNLLYCCAECVQSSVSNILEYLILSITDAFLLDWIKSSSVADTNVSLDFFSPCLMESRGNFGRRSSH